MDDDNVVDLFGDTIGDSSQPDFTWDIKTIDGQRHYVKGKIVLAELLMIIISEGVPSFAAPFNHIVHMTRLEETEH